MFQTHERRQQFKAIAERVATRLFADLKAKTIPKIDIDTIRAALCDETAWTNRLEFEALEEMTTRAVVMKVG